MVQLSVGIWHCIDWSFHMEVVFRGVSTVPCFLEKDQCTLTLHTDYVIIQIKGQYWLRQLSQEALQDGCWDMYIAVLGKIHWLPWRKNNNGNITITYTSLYNRMQTFKSSVQSSLPSLNSFWTFFRTLAFADLRKMPSTSKPSKTRETYFLKMSASLIDSLRLYPGNMVNMVRIMLSNRTYNTNVSYRVPLGKWYTA